MNNRPNDIETSPSSTAPAAVRTQSIEAVVVPLDGSDDGIRALRVAKTLALSLRCSVTAISFSPSVAPRQFERRVRRMVRHELKSAPHSIMVRPAGPSIAGDIRLELALQPRALLCMPTHGHGRSAGVMGSVTTTVIAELPRPVLLVGPNCDGAMFDPTRPLLVANDSSAPNHDTLLVANAWRSAFGSSVEQTIVVDENVSGPDVARRIAGDARSLRSSAIVMATHARQGVPRLVIGSIAANVTRFAHCPVLVHA